jgi:hypothetical protein
MKNNPETRPTPILQKENEIVIHEADDFVDPAVADDVLVLTLEMVVADLEVDLVIDLVAELVAELAAELKAELTEADIGLTGIGFVLELSAVRG